MGSLRVGNPGGGIICIAELEQRRVLGVCAWHWSLILKSGWTIVIGLVSGALRCHGVSMVVLASSYCGRCLSVVVSIVQRSRYIRGMGE